MKFYKQKTYIKIVENKEKWNIWNRNKKICKIGKKKQKTIKGFLL